MPPWSKRWWVTHAGLHGESHDARGWRGGARHHGTARRQRHRGGRCGVHAPAGRHAEQHDRRSEQLRHRRPQEQGGGRRDDGGRERRVKDGLRNALERARPWALPPMPTSTRRGTASSRPSASRRRMRRQPSGRGSVSSKGTCLSQASCPRRTDHRSRWGAMMRTTSGQSRASELGGRRTLSCLRRRDTAAPPRRATALPWQTAPGGCESHCAVALVRCVHEMKSLAARGRSAQAPGAQACRLLVCSCAQCFQICFD
ncbi:hypothetical protein EMIHUDRAFT_435892, partial [Emiliania huxleyi CCMP1516]|uniref:Uncharacterized protein n=2 Tax=Emiliania huxleyi TaxID=2903 RepID=A0A0D3JAS5_EMIH1